MPIIYQCRHCGHKIGQLDQQMVDASMLGLDQLSVEDRQDMVNYQEMAIYKLSLFAKAVKSHWGKIRSIMNWIILYNNIHAVRSFDCLVAGSPIVRVPF